MKKMIDELWDGEIRPHSAVFLFKLIVWQRLKNGKIYGIIRHRQIGI